MIRLIEKIVDYYVSKTVTNKIILLLVSSGILFIGQSIFGQIVEKLLLDKFNIEAPNLEIWGVILIVFGLLILFIDIKYKLIPSVFATQKNTRIIFLGNGKYQFVFDNKMRVTPTVCFIKPNHKDNSYNISSWDENGFIVDFELDKTIDEIDFWADGWQGLSFIHRIILSIINLFRSKDNKIKKIEYESSYAKRQIHRINNT